MLKRTAIILALGLAAGRCSNMDYKASDSKPVAREDLKNAQGHVVGYKTRIFKLIKVLLNLLGCRILLGVTGSLRTTAHLFQRESTQSFGFGQRLPG